MHHGKRSSISVMRWLFLGLVFVIAACKAETAGNLPSDPKKPRVDNSAFLAYVPEGWILQDGRILDVDIDGDGIKDAMLTVIEDDNLKKGDLPEVINERALLILIGNKEGTYLRLSFAKNALLCASCAGMMGSFGSKEPDVILYDGGTFTIGWIAGSRNTLDAEINFRFDPKLNQFMLVSDSVEKRDRVGGISTVTKRDFQAGTRTVDGKVSRMEKKVIPIEAVKYYDYLGYK